LTCTKKKVTDNFFKKKNLYQGLQKIVFSIIKQRMLWPFLEINKKSNVIKKLACIKKISSRIVKKSACQYNLKKIMILVKKKIEIKWY
jgi:hypothetical protein